MQFPSLSFCVLLYSQLAIAQNCTTNSHCGGNLCCSQYGFCGSGTQYCGNPSPVQQPPPPADAASRPKFGDVPYGTIISECKNPGQISLTYDDGPWTQTSELLDILSSLQAPSTFFLLGRTQGGSLINDTSRPWPNLIKRMVREGHQVASHTFSHKSMASIPRAEQISELAINEELFVQVLGYYPTYFRCPFLECDVPSGSLGLLGDYGYHVAGTNADTNDWRYDLPETVQQAKDLYSMAIGNNSATTGYIVLMHDTEVQTVTNLTRYTIETARARGYKLVTLGECLGDAKGNWYRYYNGTAVGPNAPIPPAPPVSTGTPSPPTVSTDGTCGDSGFTCLGVADGECCSQYGYCGDTVDHCGNGCQRAFGKCT